MILIQEKLLNSRTLFSDYSFRDHDHLVDTSDFCDQHEEKEDDFVDKMEDEGDKKDALRGDTRRAQHRKRKLDEGGQDATQQHPAADSYSEGWNLLRLAINTALPEDEEGGESLIHQRYKAM